MRPVGPARLQTGVKPLAQRTTHILAAQGTPALTTTPDCRESTTQNYEATANSPPDYLQKCYWNWPNK